MRVSQVGCGLDLSQEPLGTDHRSQLGLQHLERDVPVVLQVLGEIDRRHATFTQLTLDGVAAFQGAVQASDGVGHQLPIRSFNSSNQFVTTTNRSGSEVASSLSVAAPTLSGATSRFPSGWKSVYRWT